MAADFQWERKKRVDWEALRKVVCERYFRGRSAELCPDCKDRVVCFQMIEDAFALVDELRANKHNARTTFQTQ